MRVLFVDDMPHYRTIGGKLLESLGYPCDLADNRQSAQKLLCAHTYDLVISDDGMPHRGEGMGLLEWMRARGMSCPFILKSVVPLEPQEEAQLKALNGVFSLKAELGALEEALEKILHPGKRPSP